MSARKIFHALVGFWFATHAFIFLYLLAAAFYIWFTDRSDVQTLTPVFLECPRLAMVLSTPLPIAASLMVWNSRRYVAMGVASFGMLALAWWIFLFVAGPAIGE